MNLYQNRGGTPEEFVQVIITRTVGEVGTPEEFVQVNFTRTVGEVGTPEEFFNINDIEFFVML